MSSGESTPAAEAPPDAAEAPPVDAEAPPVDAEAPPVDAEAPPVDAETPPVDAPARTRLKPWQGLLAAFLGGSFGMIASLVVGLIALVGLLFARQGQIDLDNVEQDITALSMSLWVVVPSLFASHGTLSLVPFLTAKLAKVPIRSALGLNGAHWVAFVAAPIGIMGLGPTSDGIVHLMRWLAPEFTFGTLGQLDQLMQGHSFFMLWPLIALLPGFAEEIFFRGLVQRCLGNGALAIVVSGVSFACFHMDPQHVAGVLPVGLYLAWVAACTDSTWTTVVAHTANNSLALVGSKFLDESVGQDEPNPWIILGGLAVTALAMAAIYRSSRRRGAGARAAATDPR